METFGSFRGEKERKRKNKSATYLKGRFFEEEMANLINKMIIAKLEVSVTTFVKKLTQN